MKIRLMKIEDFEAMYDLWKKVGLKVVNYEDEKEATEQIIKWNPATCFVIFIGDKLIGTVLGTFNGRRAWIYHLAVHPNFQKKGLGTLLLEKAENALKKLGAKRILLGVSKTNLKVLGFYQKQWYVEVDDAITMGKNLLLESASDLPTQASKEKGDYVLYRY